jgi:hypothetical protein
MAQSTGVFVERISLHRDANSPRRVKDGFKRNYTSVNRRYEERAIAGVRFRRTRAMNNAQTLSAALK